MGDSFFKIVQQPVAQIQTVRPGIRVKTDPGHIFLCQKQPESQRFLKFFFDFCIFMLKLQ